jgi:hypothetical protein
MKFWGGSFWIFVNNDEDGLDSIGSVYEVPRDTPGTIRTVVAYTGGRHIVGAGVSTCAPIF